MEEHPLNESLWRRGLQGAVYGWKSVWFIILEAILAPLLGFVVEWWWSIVAVAGGMLCIWIGATARALVKQRDEARELVEQLRKYSDSEVNDTIQLLEEEKLVLKGEEEERSFSFAQVFLAIADQLSIGVSSIHFEGKIRKGLNIDERGGWYFPYEDEGITHLIGVLTQNNLVERRSEPYERMVIDYPRPNPLTGVIDYTAYATPSQHPEKGIDTIYYLSSLGRSVLKQLRQQSTVHKEGSENEL